MQQHLADVLTQVERASAPITTAMGSGPGDLRWIESFEMWQRGRSFSPHTIRRRNVSLRQFATYIAPATFATATASIIEEWIGTLQAPRTRQAYRSDIGSFYRWAVRRELIAANPVEKTDSIRVPRSLPRPIDPSLIPWIITMATDPDTKLMIALAAYAGLRRAEIAVLTATDLSLQTRPPMLVVRDGKGSKDRLVPVHPTLLEMLRQRRRATGPVFGVDANTVGRRVSTHLHVCGVIATCHQLRHTFGTELARVTRGNVPLIQQLMGHDDVSTTMGYIGWTGEGSGHVAAMYRPA